jgi:hypothetical protein
MNALEIVWLVTCFAGGALSLASARVLGARSAWTIAGWLATLAYFAIAGFDAIRARPAVAHLDTIALVFLTISFVIAGVRDEPQAEPWWWPRRSGPTGAERRAAREP